MRNEDALFENVLLNVLRGFSPLVFMLFSQSLFASQETPQSFTLDGKLYSDASTGTPLVGTGTLKIQIVDSLQTCVLYEEIQNYDTTSTDGAFNIQVGEKTTPVSKRSSGDSGHTLSDVFLNDGTLITGKLASDLSPCTGSGASGSLRYARITVTPASGSPRVLSPNLPLSSIPSALVAENAQALAGKTASQFVQTNTTAPAALSQSNLENIFSTTNYSKLTDLLAGNSSAYVKAMSNNSIQIPSSGSTPSTPAAGQLWYESGTLKYWNGSSAEALGVSGSGITSLIIGSGLSPAGTINTGGQTISVDVGVNTGQIVAVQAGQKLPALDGSNLTNLKDTSISGNLSVTTIATSANATVGGSLTVTGVTTSGEVWSNSFKVFDGSNSIELKAPTLSGSTTYSLPAAYPGVAGYVLSSNTAGVMTWVPQTASGITSLGGQTGGIQTFSAGATGTSPSITSASDIHTLNVPLASGSGVTSGTISKTEYDAFNAKLGTGSTFAGDVSGTYDNTSVDKIKGKTVTAAPTSDGQVLRYNGTSLVPNFISMFDLRSTVTGSAAFGGVGCLNSQTLTWTAATDNLACSNISLPVSQISGVLPVTNGGTGTNALPATFVLNGGQNGVVVAGTNDSNDLTLKTNGSGRMTILANGNIGIGTTAPGAKLEIRNGNLYVNPNDATNGVASPDMNQGILKFSNRFDNTANNTANKIVFFESPTIRYGIGVSDQSLNLYSGNGAFNFYTNHQDETTPGTSKLTILSGGNVGIGTTSPAYPLSVTGVIQSTTGGFRFPDGTTQATAVSSSNACKPYTSGASVCLGNGLQSSSASGDQNIAIGIGVMNSAVTGSQNTAVGRNSMTVLTSGSSNAAFGSYALDFVTTGNQNTGIGDNAGLYMASGSFNTFVGQGSANNASFTSGNSNTFIGQGSGSNQTAGSNNILIGAGVQSPSASGSNQLNIGSWIYGVSGNIGIGTMNPNDKLTIQGGGLTFSQLASDPTGTASYGSVYVKNDGKLYYRNGTGAITDLTAAGSGPSMLAVGVGTNGAPSMSFAGDTDTGFYNQTSNNTISVGVGGAKIFDFNSSGIVSPTTGGASVGTGIGTTGAPTFSFAGDTDTGWWHPATDTLAASTGGTERIRIASTGNIGIGTTNPGNARLAVNGQIAASSQSIAVAGVDFANGNTVSTSFNCSTNLTFANLRDGGNYMLIATDIGTNQCTFGTSVTGDNAATVTYRFLPPNAPRNPSSHTLYNIYRAGNIVYVSWQSGF